MIRVDLPWSAPPVTLNQRGGIHVRAKRMADAKLAAVVAIPATLGPVATPVALTLHWRPKIHRRRDVDNPIPTLKATADALVACGVIEDDDSEHVPVMAVRIHPPNGEPAAMWVTLSEPEETP